MRKRPTATLNLILFGAVLVLIVAAIVVVRLTRRTVTIMGPEPAALAAKRHSPENAYVALQAAAGMLPPPPAAGGRSAARSSPRGMPPTGRRRRRRRFRLVRAPVPLRSDTLGAWFGDYSSDSDPSLVEYIQRCAPTVKRVREALRKPYFLLAVDWKEYAETTWGFYHAPPAFLKRVLYITAGEGMYALRVNHDAATAASDFLTALRLGRLYETDGEVTAYESALSAQRDVLVAFGELLPTCPDNVLRTTLTALERLRRGGGSPARILDYQWRVLDQVVRLNPGAHFGGAFIQFLFDVRMKRLRETVVAHRKAFAEAAALRYPAFVKWKAKHPELASGRFRRWSGDPLVFVSRIVVWRSFVETYYGGAELGVALELYRRAHGSYPKTLDDLARTYTGPLPRDPFSGRAFHYRTQKGSYTLYSVGLNERDDGGAGPPVSELYTMFELGGRAPRRGRRRRVEADDIVVHRPSGKLKARAR